MQNPSMRDYKRNFVVFIFLVSASQAYSTVSRRRGGIMYPLTAINRFRKVTRPLIKRHIRRETTEIVV